MPPRGDQQEETIAAGAVGDRDCPTQGQFFVASRIAPGAAWLRLPGKSVQCVLRFVRHRNTVSLVMQQPSPMTMNQNVPFWAIVYSA